MSRQLPATIALMLGAFTMGCADPHTGDSLDLDIANGDTGDAELDTVEHDEGTPISDTADLTDTHVPPDDIEEPIDSDATGQTDAADIVDDTTAVTEITDSDTEAQPPFVCPWSSWSEGLDGGRISALDFDPRTPGLAWTTSGGVLFRSSDDGATWDEWADDAPTGRHVFPPGDQKELIGGGNGLSISYDSGRTFEQLALNGIATTAVMLDPAIPMRVWVGTTGLGILRSDNRGQTFTPRSTGVPLSQILSFVGFADAPEVTLVGTVRLNESLGVINRGQVLRTTNGGQSWQVVVDDAVWVPEMVTCPAQPGLVYAAIRSGVRRSTDYGQTWTPVPAVAGLDVLNLALSSDCSVLWASVYQRGLYRLTDGGATIEGPIIAGLDLQLSALAGDIVVNPNDPTILLLGTHGGLYRSVDGGFSWRRAPAAKSLSVFGISSSPLQPDRVYLATWGGGLWVRDGEEPWRKSPLPNADFIATVSLSPTVPERVVIGASGWNWLGPPSLTSLRPFLWGQNVGNAHFFADGRILVSTQVSGFHMSEDSGATWRKVNTGLQPWPTPAGVFTHVSGIVADPDDESVLFGGTVGRGVVVSRDGGESWSFIDNELGNQMAPRLIVSRRDGLELFALVFGRGIFRSVDEALTWQEASTGLASGDVTFFVEDRDTGFLYVSGSFTPVMRSVDRGASWQALSSFCGDPTNVSGLAIMEIDGVRWLVASKARNTILRHRLSAP